MNRDLKFPTLQIAGLTDTEKTVQDQVASYLQTAPADFELSSNYFRDVLKGEYDPETSRYYKGIRGQLDTQKDDAQADVKRSAQKAGTARATPSLGIEQRAGQDYDFEADKVLGSLLQDERQFMAQAGQVLPALKSEQLNQLGAADQIASKPRMIEQMRKQATYDKMVNDMLAQYKYQANIAMALLNESRYVGYGTGGGLTDLGFLVSAGASAGASYSSKGGGTKGGSSGGGGGGGGGG